MVMDVIWFLIYFFMGIIAGEFGKYLVASMAMAANEAVVLGVGIGFIAGAILVGIRQCMDYFD